MNRSIVVSVFIISILYIFLITGYFILLSPAFQKLQGIFVIKKRLKMNGEQRNTSIISKHLNQILLTTGVRCFTPYRFVAFSCIIFLLFFYLGIQSFSAVITFLLSSFGGILPYGLLRIRLESIRHKGSFEGEEVISEFLRQYRICNYNVYETLEQMIANLKHCKISRRLFFQILLRLRNTGNPILIREACELYYFGIHTNWSRMLATNLQVAAEKGVNISLAVEDILIQLRDARSATEERRRMNSEATRMTVFMIPLLYVATILLACRYMDLPFSSFCANQFQTSQGLLFFLFIWFSFLFNLLVLDYFNHHRFDC